MSFSAIEISICVECLQFLANGPDAIDPTKAAEIAAAVQREGGHVVVACKADCEGPFSWSPCGLCGDTLGGERHTAAVLPKSHATARAAPGFEEHDEDRPY